MVKGILTYVGIQEHQNNLIRKQFQEPFWKLVAYGAFNLTLKEKIVTYAYSMVVFVWTFWVNIVTKFR